MVDDYPATGKTLRLTINILRECGVAAHQLAIIAPTHAAQPNWIEVSGIQEPISTFTVRPWELHKAALMAISSLSELDFSEKNWDISIKFAAAERRKKAIAVRRIRNLRAVALQLPYQPSSLAESPRTV